MESLSIMLGRRLAMPHSQIPLKAQHVAVLEMPAQSAACVLENRDSHTEEHVQIGHSHQTIVHRYVTLVGCYQHSNYKLQ
jgi:hypothetical protein